MFHASGTDHFMRLQGWQQQTIWLLGQRMPLGDPHDGQGHRPQLGTLDTPGQSSQQLLICDELNNLYRAVLKGNRIISRHWLSLRDTSQDSDSKPCPIGLGSLAHQPQSVHRAMTAALWRDSHARCHLIQSWQNELRQYHQAADAQTSNDACADVFTSPGRVVLQQPGQPLVAAWHRDDRASLLLAQPEGSIRIWHGLEKLLDGPDDVPGQFYQLGQPLLAGGMPLRFEGQVHMNLVDWNQRGRQDLLIATAQGQLWLFYDVGDDNTIRYDAGRRLADRHGPIELLGPCSATILSDDKARRLVAADSQGQLWHWPLEATPSWHVSDWSKAARIAGNHHTLGHEPLPGQWWQDESSTPNHSHRALRIGPRKISKSHWHEGMLTLAPVPSELVIPIPFRGPCELHVTLGSMEDVFEQDDDPNAIDPGDTLPLKLDSMIDVRLGGEISPHLLCAQPMRQGQSQEIYWGTANLSGASVHLHGLHGGMRIQGCLPANIITLRVVPLTPQAEEHSEKAAETVAAAAPQPAAPQTIDAKPAIVLEDASASSPAEASKARIVLADATTTRDDDESDVDEFDPDDTDPDDDEMDDDVDAARARRIDLGGMIDPLAWTSLVRADSTMEIDQLIARHQAASIDRLYWRAGPSPWTFPSKVAGANVTAPPHASPRHEAHCQQLADHFEHINRLQLAIAAANGRNIQLFAWIDLSSQQPASEHGMACADQFLLDHPEFAERDQHGQPLAGRLCLAYPQVRKFFIDVILEMVDMGIEGLLIDTAAHLPCVSHGQPVLDAFQKQHNLDMRTLSPFDLRVVKHQADIMTGFLRELRMAVHHARPRRRLPIHVTVNRPYAMLGCDPGTWSREHLVDALVMSSFYDEARRSDDLQAMGHLIEETNCEIGVMLWADHSHNISFAAHKLVESINKHIAKGASFVILQDTARLVCCRGLCQSLAHLNYPMSYQPRAVLG